MHHMAIVLQSSRSPLLEASSSDVVKILIEAGANVNVTDEVGTCIFIETFVFHISVRH